MHALVAVFIAVCLVHAAAAVTCKLRISALGAKEDKAQGGRMQTQQKIDTRLGWGGTVDMLIFIARSYRSFQLTVRKRIDTIIDTYSKLMKRSIE